MDHGEAPLRDLPKTALRRQCEIGIAPNLAPADASAKLVELGKSEKISAVHDQRVGGRNVEAGLDDVGGEQQIDLMVVKGPHHLFQLLCRHTAIGNPDLDFGHQRLQLVGELALILNPWTDVERLTAAIVLAQDCFPQDDRIGRQHKGAHGQSIDRRRCDDREFLQTAKRHLQRARNRRCRHGQHMHLGAHLLQTLFVHHAEMLLFVNDHQAQILEFNFWSKQRMSTRRRRRSCLLPIRGVSDSGLLP